jgi:nucleotidyltransferase/DNA polymerase involved in DNA repair
MGVTQKYLIVTCNYPARAAGVTKLMGIVEAKKKCPDLVLINGEDLTVCLGLIWFMPLPIQPFFLLLVVNCNSIVPMVVLACHLLVIHMPMK